MADRRNAAGVPLTYRGYLWSKILDAMIGGSVAANGDLLYRTGGVWTRKAVGANGRLLKVLSSLPDWSLPTGGGSVGFAVAAYQASAQTANSGNTGTTYTDTQLAVGLEAGTYLYQLQSFFTGDTVPDMKHRLHYTGTATEVKYLAAQINIGNTAYNNQFEEAFDVDINNTTNLGYISWFQGTMKLTTMGTFSYQFAQIAAHGNNVTEHKGGFLYVWQIA